MDRVAACLSPQKPTHENDQLATVLTWFYVSLGFSARFGLGNTRFAKGSTTYEGRL